MDQTPNLNLPIPNADAVPPTNISDEFPRIALALTMLDTIIHALQGVVEGKAEADHTQAMSTITGLVEALAAKMPADTTFSLDDLEDVMGAADALVNYVLVKNASGFWVPSTALAALGVHNHAISEVVGLADLLDDMSDALDLLVANKADKAITVTGGGLAAGGGSLAANRVITVTKATDAEATARSRDDVAVSPKGAGLAAIAVSGFERISLIEVTTPVAVVDWTNLDAFRDLILELTGAPVVNGTAPHARVSINNGVSFLSGASDYGANRIVGNGGSLAAATVAYSYFSMAENGFSSTLGGRSVLRLSNFNRTSLCIGEVSAGFYVGGNTLFQERNVVVQTANASIRNALRFAFNSGNIAAGTRLTLWGQRG